MKLLEVKRADALAHADTPRSRQRYQEVLEFTALTQTVLAEEPCFRVSDLAIGGREVLSRGVAPGPQVGQLLQALLEAVIEERCENTPEALGAYLDEILKGNEEIHGN
jgi:tRNA nucleotidyltransferase (CCA-adding enzyme)